MNELTSPPRTARRRRGPAVLAVAVAALGCAAVAPTIANGATVTQPQNQTFDSGATTWNATGSCTVLNSLLNGLGLSATAGADPDDATPLTPAILGSVLGPLLGAPPGDPLRNVGNLLNDLLAGEVLGGDSLALLQNLVDGLDGGSILPADLLDLVNGNNLLNPDGLINTLTTLAGGAVGTVNGLLAGLGLLCTTTAGFTAADGNPPGALQVEVSGLLPSVVNVLQLLGRAEATFTSAYFTHTRAQPTAVAFSFDAKADLDALINVGEGFRVTATLERNGGATTALGSYDFTNAAQFRSFANYGVAVPANVIVPGGIYRIRFQVESIGTLSLLQQRHRLVIDNVRLAATVPDGGGDGPGGGGDGGGDDNGQGAGGLGACTTNLVQPTAPPTGGPRGTVTMSRQQMLINQRISQAGVRRVNTVLDQFQAGLTGSDFQNCSIGTEKFAPALLQAITAGQPAAPATNVAGPRPTVTRTTKEGNPGGVTLSRAQLLINQRISQAAVRRVNAIQARLKGGITAGDLRLGSLQAVSLNTAARRTFAGALPAASGVSTAFVPFDIARKGEGNPGQVTLSRQQLLINQRISQAAVRRINAIQAQMRVGLSGGNIKDGGLARATLAPSIQLGQR